MSFPEETFCLHSRVRMQEKPLNWIQERNLPKPLIQPFRIPPWESVQAGSISETTSLASPSSGIPPLCLAMTQEILNRQTTLLPMGTISQKSTGFHLHLIRSEERRVGKESRYRRGTAVINIRGRHGH